MPASPRREIITFKVIKNYGHHRLTRDFDERLSKHNDTHVKKKKKGIPHNKTHTKRATVL